MSQKTKRITFSAVMMAVSAVLYSVSNMIPFLNLPFGGTITLASLLPIVLVAYIYGMKWGFFTAFSYSLLRIALSLVEGTSSAVAALFLPGSDFTAVQAFLIVFLDYICAYSVLFVGGIFRKMKSRAAALAAGTALALLVCWFFHTLSGAIFYGEWAEWFFTETAFSSLGIGKAIMAHGGAALPWIYSAVYNACYMLPETVISVVCAVVVSGLTQISAKTE